MAELTPQEKLQPSLLDRLTDDDPEKQVESRQNRVLNMQQLRECVLRDLAWLLNSGPLSQTQDLSRHPEVERSVLNYGSPDLAGATVSSTNVAAVEDAVRRAIVNFEPRILKSTIRVRAVKDDEEMNANALVFVIEGELWAQPVPLNLYLKTEVDLDTGQVRVFEYSP
ncbi:MAG: type VI secretion system baseplate subunit TssE [Pirellulaceae bacterium]|nr:type VI secretion system baseplate subunit TssE [Pirellulaceae bacterium]